MQLSNGRPVEFMLHLYPPRFTETYTQLNGRMMSFPRTSVAKLLCTPAFQFGTSNVDVWHHGLSVSSFSMTRAKCSDQPLRGTEAEVYRRQLRAVRDTWTQRRSGQARTEE